MATENLLKSCRSFDACRSTLNTLRSEMSTLKSRYGQSGLIGYSSKLQRAQAENDLLTLKISQEEDEVSQLRQRAASLLTSLEDRRKAVGKSNEANNLTLKIRSLQTKIALKNEIYNEHLSINTSLRNTINDLRREKIIQDSSYKLLSNSLLEQKLELKNLEEKNSQILSTKSKLAQEITEVRASTKKQQKKS